MASEAENDVNFMADIYDHANAIREEEALKLCADHLKDEWDKISIDDFSMTVVQ